MDGGVYIKAGVFLGVLSLESMMIGGDDAEVKEETMADIKEEVKLLTEKEIQSVKKEAKEEQDKLDLLILLLKKCTGTILVEELAKVGTKMNEFRNILDRGILRFTNKDEHDTVKLNRLVEAFRAWWND